MTTAAACHITQVWALPFSLATTQGVEVSFLSSGYLDVSVPQLASTRPMYSGGSTRALPRVSFLIRRSRDQRSVSISPGLIAAAHVLHRLLAPRHPPCALVLLISKNTLCCRYGVFKVHAGEVDVVLGESAHRTARRPSNKTDAYQSQELRYP